MELLTPGIGLIFWTALVFLLVLFILAKFAWKPIIDAVNERERTIEDSLKEAERARDEMATLKSDNERLLDQAREERMVILKEARELKDDIISEAREQAKIEASKVMEETREEIEVQKKRAVMEIKLQSARLAIDIAEKILKDELKHKSDQEEYIDRLVSDINLN